MAINYASGKDTDFGDISAIDSISNFTLMFWAKRDIAGSQIFVGESASSTSASYVLLFTDGRVFFQLRNGASTGRWVTFNETGWHHYVMVFDGTEAVNFDRIKGFVDGEEEVLSTNGTVAPSTTASNSAVFNVGQNLTTEGSVAEVKILTSSLTPEEIKAEYNQGRVYADAGYWPLDTLDATDYSGNGNDGTNTGSPTVDGHPSIPAQWGFDDYSNFESGITPSGNSAKLVNGFLIDNYLIDGSLVQ